MGRIVFVITTYWISDYNWEAWCDNGFMSFGYTEEDAVRGVLNMLEDVYGADIGATKTRG